MTNKISTWKTLDKRASEYKSKLKHGKTEDGCENGSKLIYISGYCIISIGHWSIRFSWNSWPNIFVSTAHIHKSIATGCWIIDNGCPKSWKKIKMEISIAAMIFPRQWVNRKLWLFWSKQSLPYTHAQCLPNCCHFSYVSHQNPLFIYDPWSVMDCIRNIFIYLGTNFQENLDRVISIGMVKWLLRTTFRITNWRPLRNVLVIGHVTKIPHFYRKCIFILKSQWNCADNAC